MSGVGADGFCAPATAISAATVRVATRIAAVRARCERRRNASVIIELLVGIVSCVRILAAVCSSALVLGASSAAGEESSSVRPVADVLVSRQLAARARLAVGDA